jgi:hypothetical protein
MNDKLGLALGLVNAIADSEERHIRLASNGKGAFLELVVAPAAPDDYKYVVQSPDRELLGFTNLEQAVEHYIDVAY